MREDWYPARGSVKITDHTSYTVHCGTCGAGNEAPLRVIVDDWKRYHRCPAGTPGALPKPVEAAAEANPDRTPVLEGGPMSNRTIQTELMALVANLGIDPTAITEIHIYAADRELSIETLDVLNGHPVPTTRTFKLNHILDPKGN